MREFSIDKSEVYRYLGYNPKEHTLSEEIKRLTDICIGEVFKVASPKTICSPFLLLKNEGEKLYAESLLLDGNDIREHLKNCSHAVLIGATLGAGIDALIRKYEAIDMTKAVILDSSANVLVEDIADSLEEELREKLLSEQRYLTSRFSAGYGDFPISTQSEIIRITDAPRKAGLTVTAENIMIPRKSITAVMGISDIEVKGKLAGCNSCVLKDKCIYRKKGKSCAISD